MSQHRTDIEETYDDLFDAAGEQVYVKRGNETIGVLAIVEKPTRELISDAGEIVFIDTPRLPFVIRSADYKFENVPVTPSKDDRIEYRGRSYQPWTQGNTIHIDPAPFHYAWRVYGEDCGCAE